MSEHVLDWLAAYYDQELSAERMAEVETHLAVCQACKAELETLRRLSALLKTVPSPSDAPFIGRYPAQLRRRIAQLEPERPAWQRALQFGWSAAPWIIIATWAFFQAVLLTTGGLMTAQNAGLDLGWLALPGDETSNGNWWSILTAQIPGLDLGEPVLTGLALNLSLTALFALLLWGWLAGWWVYRRHQVLASSELHSLS